jgi:ubiquinone/menaquinone biosynthesis C-methylase UbiE
MLKILFHHLKVLILGTREYEEEWEFRHLSKNQKSDWKDGDPDWVRGYWSSRDHPHREYLTQIIADMNPSTILEIGSNCGPNLRILARKLPHSRLIGIDINPEAVKWGNIWLREEGIDNVKIILGKADDLSQFSNNSFDVVLTDAVLIYIGPDKICRILKEIYRVGKEAIVLFEWNKNISCGLNPLHIKNYIFRRGLWAWNYCTLLKEIGKIKKISCNSIPENLWSDSGWKKYGSLITAELHHSENCDDIK